ncbi:MAG: sulfotransferase family 2 domain-containing protein [Devosiaceae bacterium]
MLVNWQQNYVFVHVPKTGGTSITQLLKHDCVRPPLPLRAIGYAFDHAGHTLPATLFPIVGYPYHARASDLRAAWGERDAQLCSVAFVRNPWDLGVPEYHFIASKWDHPHRATVRQLGSFETYVHWKRDTGNHTNQVAWLHDDKGNQIVSKIGRFERYQKDAEEILQRLKCRRNLPHANATRHANYIDHYTSKTRAMVGQMYANDIAKFDYVFS